MVGTYRERRKKNSPVKKKKKERAVILDVNEQGQELVQTLKRYVATASGGPFPFAGQ